MTAKFMTIDGIHIVKVGGRVCMFECLTDAIEYVLFKAKTN